MPASVHSSTVFHATRLALAAAEDAAAESRESGAEEGLLRDAFVSLFDRMPHLLRDVPEELALRREMFRLATSTQLYADLNTRSSHRYDLSAALTPMWAAEVLKAERNARTALEELKQARKRVQATQEAGKPAAEEAVRAAERRAKEVMALARRQVMARLSQMRDAVQLAEDLTRMGWGTEAGAFVRMAADGQVRARTVQAVKKVAAWFGRLRELWAVAKTRVPRRGPRVAGVTRGSDLPRMLPQEHLRLSAPGLDMLWALDYARRRLLQYQRAGAQHRASRGPVIVLVDESGSMQGEPAAYAKAFAFLLRLEAKAENRACHLVSFSYRPQDMHELPDGATAQEAAEWAARFVGGGTDWVPPLSRALELLRDPAYARADVVMLTDGACEVPAEKAQQIRSSLASREARLFCFLFGAGNPRPLQPLATGIWKTALDERGILQVLEAFQSSVGGD
jgi:uncharacterized protein with von Willebrand factor type A (vWA) domain